MTQRPVVVRAPDGDEVPAPTCLLIAIDETGHEELADPKYPVFGLGGCLTVVREYHDQIRAPWALLKQQHSQGGQVPLHRGAMLGLGRAERQRGRRYERAKCGGADRGKTARGSRSAPPAGPQPAGVGVYAASGSFRSRSGAVALSVVLSVRSGITRHPGHRTPAGGDSRLVGKCRSGRRFGFG